MEIEQAKQTIQEETNARQNACGEEIKAVLQKYNCSLNIAMIVSKQGNEPIIQVRANDN